MVVVMVSFSEFSLCLAADSQVNGSPLASPASVPSPKQETSKPSLLAQFLQNRKEQVHNNQLYLNNCENGQVASFCSHLIHTSHSLPRKGKAENISNLETGYWCSSDDSLAVASQVLVATYVDITVWVTYHNKNWNKVLNASSVRCFK